LLKTVIALAVVQTALTIAVAIFAPKEAKAPRDERDRLIDLRATRFAYAALAGSLACACFFGGFNPPVIFNVNALLSISGASRDPAFRLPDHPIPAWCLTWLQSATKSDDCASSMGR
jgi:hypothetical protein